MSAGTYQCFTGAHNRNRNEGCGLESVQDSLGLYALRLPVLVIEYFYFYLDCI
jgi:hypothetical protein